MPKFRILTPAGLSFSNSGGGYSFEMEALEGLDAEIFECPANEAAFIAAAKGVDAVYAKGMKFTRAMIRSLFAHAGFRLERSWYDERRWFGVHLARVPAVRGSRAR